MSDTYNSTSQLSNNVQDAYRKLVDIDFESKKAFAQFGEAEPWSAKSNDPFPSNVVKRLRYDLVQPQTSAIASESTDPARKGLTNAFSTITMYEYGDTISCTQKLVETSFSPIHEQFGALISEGMSESVDLIARAAFDAETGTQYNTYVGGGSAATGIAKTEVMTSTIMNTTRGKLLRKRVPAYNSSVNGLEMLRGGKYYMAIVHPDVLTDVQSETGSGGWLLPHEYANASELYNFEEGMWKGFRIVTSDLAKIQYNGGTGTATDIDEGAGVAIGTTAFTLTAGTNVTSGGTITIVDQGSGTDDYTYEVTGIATNEVTLGYCIAKNNIPYYTSTAGIVEIAAVDADVVKTGNDVYTSYFFGSRAIGYAESVAPHSFITKPSGGLERITDFNWYGLMGYGALEAKSLHKVFSGSAVSPNEGDA